MNQLAWRSLLMAAMAVSWAVAPTEVAAQRSKRPFRVMLVSDGASEQFDGTRETFERELRELFGADVELVFVEPSVETNWTMNRAARALDEALSNDSVDLVVGFGAMVGVAAGRKEKLERPVLLPFAAPKLQGLPRDGNRSGRRNLVYIAGLLDFEGELRKLEDVVAFERMAFVVGAEVVLNLQDPTEPVQRASRALGIETRLVIADKGPEAVLRDIPEDAEAVYIGFLPSWTKEEMQTLIDGVNARGLPSYADDLEWVERGALVTMESREDDIRRMRRAALYAQRIYFGERPEELSVSFQPRPQLVINMATARAIGTWPRFSIMAEARLINDEGARLGPLITLDGAMRDSVLANLDLMARGIGVDAGKENVKQARGRWFFNADAAGEYAWTDPDITSVFSDAERQFTWRVEGDQLLYSARAQGNLRAERALQRGLVDEYDSARLDLMLEAGVSYLNVLRAKNNERVSRDNLKLTRRNLALAETRYEIGVAGREEVIRWEIEIADSRAALIDASAVREQAEIDLNRILNRPLEAPFQTPLSDDDSLSPGGDPRLNEFIEDPYSFAILRDFLSEEAIRNSPEIKAIDENIDAQREVLKAERRTLGIPDTSIFGGFQHIPHVAGSGSQAIDTGAEGFFPTRDTFTWRTGVAARLTLFDGTQNYARIRQANLVVDQLQTDRAALAQRIEQELRASLHQAGASYANIELAQDAARAAAKNLELVTDAYQRGAVDIIRLIDAQNQAIISELAASNAQYDFLIDALRVERATGSFQLEFSEDAQEDLWQRLNAFADEKKRALPKPEPPASLPNPAHEEIP